MQNNIQICFSTQNSKFALLETFLSYRRGIRVLKLRVAITTPPPVMTFAHSPKAYVAILLICQIFSTESQTPTLLPTPSTILDTTAPSSPTFFPTLTPSSGSEVHVSPGAMAATVIFATIGSGFILAMFIYLFRAPKGSSPGSFYFPEYYTILYPNRPHFTGKVMIEELPTIEEK